MESSDKELGTILLVDRIEVHLFIKSRAGPSIHQTLPFELAVD